MSTFDSHREVVDVDESTLRSLISEGEPREKVWAAWELAIRLGGESTQPLKDRLADEPTPGVRAHLVVVLIGLAEIDAVLTLAHLDPSAFVRETACRHLTRLSGKRMSLQEPLLERLDDPSPRVRQVILRHLKSPKIPELTEKLLILATDPDTQVRHALLDHWVAEETDIVLTVNLKLLANDPELSIRKRVSALLLERAPEDLSWLQKCLLQEEDEALRADLVCSWVENGGMDELCEALLDVHPEQIFDVIEPVAKAGHRCEWALLEPLFERSPDAPTHLALGDMLQAETMPSEPASGLIDTVVNYFLDEEVWLPQLMDFVRPLIETHGPYLRPHMELLRRILRDELESSLEQGWGPVKELREILQSLDGTGEA